MNTQNPFEIKLTIVGLKIRYDINGVITTYLWSCQIFTLEIVRFTSNGFWVKDMSFTEKILFDINILSAQTNGKTTTPNFGKIAYELNQVFAKIKGRLISGSIHQRGDSSQGRFITGSIYRE
jgi:hypothetical protein